MGVTNSKGPLPSQLEKERRHSRKMTGIDRLQSIKNSTRMLQSQINTFRGSKTSSEYLLYHSMLTKNSQDIQDIRKSSKAKKKDTMYNDALNEINVAIKTLEDRVNRNMENDLDMAAVESTSFINTNMMDKFHQKTQKSGRSSGRHSRRIHSFGQLEIQTSNLEDAVRHAVDESDFKAFPLLEKKIEILFTDLEMIKIDNDTQMQSTKTKIGEKLLRCNSKLKKAKRNSLPASKRKRDTYDRTISSMSKSTAEIHKMPADDMIAIMKMESELGDIEVKVSLFEDTKSDATYIDLSNILKANWGALHCMNDINEEMRERRMTTIELIKGILHDLNKKADDNANTLKRELGDITVIEKEVTKLKSLVDGFAGTKYSEDYVTLDQGLRKNWAKLSDINDTYEKVKVYKDRLIKDIQAALKLLNERVASSSHKKKNDSKHQSNVIVKDIEKIYNDWSQLRRSMENLNIDENDEVRNILEKFQDQLHVVLGTNNNHNRKHTTDFDTLPKHRSTEMIDQLIQEISSDKTPNLDPIEVPSNYAEQPAPVLYNPISEMPQLSKVTPKEPETYIYSFANNQDHKIEDKPPETVTNEDDPSTSTIKVNKLVPVATVIENKQTESVLIKALPSTSNFGKLHSILKQIDAIKSEIRNFSGTKESERYFEFEMALSTLQSEVEDIKPDGNNTISIAKTKANKKLHETVRILEEKVKENVDHKKEVVQHKIEEAEDDNQGQKKLDVIMAIDNKVHRLQDQIGQLNPGSGEKEITDLVVELNGCEDALMGIEDDHQQNLVTSKHEVLEHVSKLKQALAEKKKLQQQNQDAADLRIILQRVMKVKKRIDSFYGTYKNVQYVQLEKELQSCLEQIKDIKDNNDKLVTAKQHIIQKIESYLSILDEKSVKISVSSEQESVEPGYELIDKVRAKILEFKDASEQFNGSYTDPKYAEIEDGLFRCNEDLNMIGDKHKSVHESKKIYKEYIKDLLKYLDDKAKVNHTPMENGGDPISQQLGIPTDETELILDKINREIDLLKDDVNNFEGTRQNPDYIKLDDQLTKKLVDLEKIQCNTMAMQLQHKRIKMDVANCAQILESKVRNEEDEVQLRNLEAKGEEVKKDIDQVNPGDEEVINQLQYRLKGIITCLDNLKVDGYGSIKERKRNARKTLGQYEEMLINKALGSNLSEEHYLLKELDTLTGQLRVLGDQVRIFYGYKHDQQHTKLDEALINLFLKVDSIDPKINEEMRLKKFEVMKEIQMYMQILDKNSIQRESGIFVDSTQGTQV